MGMLEPDADLIDDSALFPGFTFVHSNPKKQMSIQSMKQELVKSAENQDLADAETPSQKVRFSAIPMIEQKYALAAKKNMMELQARMGELEAQSAFTKENFNYYKV
jgi:hypothetical protein